MIEKTPAWKVGDKSFLTLAAAQEHELVILFSANGSNLAGKTDMEIEEFAGLIVANADAIMNILSTTAKSRTRARKANGAVRKKKQPVDAQVGGHKAQ